MPQGFIRYLLSCLFLTVLAGCSPTPAMQFELLEPTPGAVGARITARLTVTGTDDVSFNSFIKVVDTRHPDTDFRSVPCSQECAAQEIQVPSGTYEVFGTMIYRDREGGERTLTSERSRVEIDATPIVAFLIPPVPPSQRLIKVLFTRPVLADSVNADTVQLERTFQSGPIRYRMTTEAVPVQFDLVDRTLSIRGDFSAPAQYVLRIQGVRDAPGNRVSAELPFTRHYFTHGPALYEHLGGQLQRLERDAQQRLYHLAADGLRRVQIASRLEGTEWVDLATLSADEGTLATIDRQGAPVAYTAPVRGGDIMLKRWNGSTWEAWGPVLGESATSSTGFFLVQVRVDSQNRPLVLVSAGANAPFPESVHLYRLEGSAWRPLPHAIAAGTVYHSFFPLGASLALGWKSRASGGDALAARIDEGGLVPLAVPPGVEVDWSHAVPAGATQSYVPRPRFAEHSAVMLYDGQSLSEVGDMRGYLEPTDPTAGNTILGEVRTLTTDETGAPTVFLRAEIFAGVIDGAQVRRLVLGALRFDGRAWTPLRGAPAAVLVSGEPEAAWMSRLPPGSAPVALEAAYTPDGALWMLQSHGLVSGGVARSWLSRAHHAP
jgi:hypothetical protein